MIPAESMQTVAVVKAAVVDSVWNTTGSPKTNESGVAGPVGLVETELSPALVTSSNVARTGEGPPAASPNRTPMENATGV